MADLAHKETDDVLRELEEKIKAEFEAATKDVEQKYIDYMSQFNDDLADVRRQLANGEITQKDYDDFVYRKTMVGKRWKTMQETLARDFDNAGQIAMGMTKKTMPDVYALNGNWATYQIEKEAEIDTGFTLYNHDTAEYLLGDQRQLMPRPSKKKAAEIAKNKNMQWNKEKIQSCVLQGVLQGEPVTKIAERLRSVGQMNYKSSIRYARTMTTSAQNAGRYQAYRRAQSHGVDLTIEWSATLDNRTRHDHRSMHGQRRNVDEPFVLPDGHEILYPADCTGDNYEIQREIWNCRCTLMAWVKGFEGDTITRSPKMGNISYDDWKNAKGQAAKSTPSSSSRPSKISASKGSPVQKQSYTFKELVGKAYEGNSYSTDEMARLKKVYESAPEYLQEFYHRFGGELEPVVENNHGKTPQKGERFGYFIRSEGKSGRVHFMPSQDAAGNSNKAPFELGCHEYGHNMDYLGGKKNKTAYLSNQYRETGTGRTFLQIINDDFENAIKKHVGKSSSENVTKDDIDSFCKMMKTDYPLRARGCLSDMFENYSINHGGPTFPFGVGHGKNKNGDYYANRPGATEREAFAEITQCVLANPDGLDLISKYIPNAYNAYKEMIVEASNGKK